LDEKNPANEYIFSFSNCSLSLKKLFELSYQFNFRSIIRKQNFMSIKTTTFTNSAQLKTIFSSFISSFYSFLQNSRHITNFTKKTSNSTATDLTYQELAYLLHFLEAFQFFQALAYFYIPTFTYFYLILIVIQQLSFPQKKQIICSDLLVDLKRSNPKVEGVKRVNIVCRKTGSVIVSEEVSHSRGSCWHHHIIRCY
jgi:hypothetical protein